MNDNPNYQNNNGAGNPIHQKTVANATPYQPQPHIQNNSVQQQPPYIPQQQFNPVQQGGAAVADRKRTGLIIGIIAGTVALIAVVITIILVSLGANTDNGVAQNLNTPSFHMATFENDLEDIEEEYYDSNGNVKDSYIKTVLDKDKQYLEDYNSKHHVFEYININYERKCVECTLSDGGEFHYFPGKNSESEYIEPEETQTDETETADTTAETNDWRQAYMDYLYAYMDEAEYPDSCSFNLVYIDDDDTPELVISDGNSHVSAASVYTCVNSEVVELVVDLSGTFGAAGYAEREGLIYSNVCYQGNDATTIYKVESGTCEELISLYTNEAATPEGTTPEYKINDESVSKDEYDAAWEEYENDNLSYSSDNSMALTADSIDSIANY